MTALIIASLSIMAASLAGVFSFWKKAGDTIERNLHFLISFSAGVFLVVAIELSMETFAHARSILASIVWVVIGGLIVFAIFKILPLFHHHHNNSSDCVHDHRLDAKKILASDAIHNVGDGILLAASFSISVPIGIMTASSVFVHEIIQETSEFFVLKQAGYSTARSLITNFLVSSTILIGALGSALFLKTFELFEAPILGIAAGSFFVVVANDLIPHSVKDPSFKKHSLRHIVWFAAGLIIMLGANSYFGHPENNSHRLPGEFEEQITGVIG